MAHCPDCGKIQDDENHEDHHQSLMMMTMMADALLTMEEKDGQKENESWERRRRDAGCEARLWTQTFYLTLKSTVSLSVSSWHWWIELNECIEHDYYMMVRWCLVSFSRCSLCFRIMLWIHEEVEDWGKCPSLSVSLFQKEILQIYSTFIYLSIDVSSYEVPGDLIWRSISHNENTWRAWIPCVS